MAKKSPLGVDFIVRTMMERESSGKRRIRPKNVEDVLLPEDSDDSDYDYVGGSDDYDEDDSAEENSTRSDDDSSDNDEDDTDESSSDDDSGNSDDESSQNKSSKSALRETLKKINDSSNFPLPKKKRKKPKTKSKNSSAASSVNNTIHSSSTVELSKSKDGSGEVTQNGPGSGAVTKKKSKPKPKVNKQKSAHTNGSSDKGGNKSKNKKRKRDESSSKKSHKKPKYNSISSLVSRMEALQAEGRNEINLDYLICSFCLGDKSDETNEIIECDSCGITIHEMCYGVSDNASVSSGTESSNSTEPWFCDACKSGLRNIKCELCPNEGGVFKETITGRWVHLICATYTPNARIGEDGLANILDVSYSNWGYHACSVCEDERYSRIGMTIRCDAGLCRTYLHATCAHKLGLLSDPTIAGDLAGQVADPYFAACKMHTNREVARRRADNYKILQEQLRARKERKQSGELTEKEKTIQSRSKNKIEKIRSKMAAKLLQSNLDSQESSRSQMQGNLTDNLGGGGVGGAKQGRNLVSQEFLTWREGTKKSRMLHTSPYIDMFLRKAALTGEDLAYEVEDKNDRIVGNVRRKWNVQPALTVEYTAYYLDRELRLATLGDQCEKLEKEKMDLIDKHAGLKSAYEAMNSAYRADSEETEKVAKNLESLREILTVLSPSNQKLNIVVPKRRHSSSMNSRTSPAKRDKRSPSSKQSKSKSKNSSFNGSQSPTGRLGIVKCAVCKNSENQHLITRCDECKKNYHLGCLDPPLSRMPKKSKSFGWMCSDCGDESEESDTVPVVDTEAPRTLRGREKLKKPNKYRSVVSPVAHNHNVSPKVSKGPALTTKGGGGGDKEHSTSYWGPPTKTSPSNNIGSGDSTLNNFNEGKCQTCQREDFKKNLVMCDKCSLEFHFLCLDPPLKYSPKRRGYSWFCADCDDASSVDSHRSVKDETNPLSPGAK